MIGIIAATTFNGIIGVENKLPFNYPEDMGHFRKVTTNCIVIMGKNTFYSIGKPLPKRRNIVLTKSTIEDVETVGSLEEALQLCRNDERDIWLIGGASVYEEGLKFADKILLTITPDIEERIPNIKFPWINPSLFKLDYISQLSVGSELMLAAYSRQ